MKSITFRALAASLLLLSPASAFGQGAPLAGTPTATYVASPLIVAPDGDVAIDVSISLVGVTGIGCSGAPVPALLGGYQFGMDFDPFQLQYLSTGRCATAPDEYAAPVTTNVTDVNTTGKLVAVAQNGGSQAGPAGAACYATVRFKARPWSNGSTVVHFRVNSIAPAHQAATALLTCPPNPNRGPVVFPLPAQDVTVTFCSAPATPAPTSNSPVCQGQTVNLSTGAVPGATYAWTGPGGFTSSAQNPSIPAAQPAMSGTYSVTVTASGCSSAAGTTQVTVNADVTPPVVTPPSPAAVTVNQTACVGGVPGATLDGLLARYPAQHAALDAMLQGGSAIDACSATTTRLTPRLGATDIVGTTLLPVGDDTVTLRFSDGNGNVGTAPVVVTVRRQGDVDASGVVDVFDVVTIAAYIVGNVQPGSPPFVAPLEVADTDGNAVIDLFDLIVVQAFVVGNVPCLTP